MLDEHDFDIVVFIPFPRLSGRRHLFALQKLVDVPVRRARSHSMVRETRREAAFTGGSLLEKLHIGAHDGKPVFKGLVLILLFQRDPLQHERRSAQLSVAQLRRHVLKSQTSLLKQCLDLSWGLMASGS